MITHFHAIARKGKKKNLHGHEIMGVATLGQITRIAKLFPGIIAAFSALLET